jgi:hypothetical protein
MLCLTLLAGCVHEAETPSVNIPARIHAATMRLSEKRQQERSRVERETYPEWVEDGVLPPEMTRKYTPPAADGSLPPEYLQDVSVRIRDLCAGESCFVYDGDLWVDSRGFIHINLNGIAYAGRSPIYCRHIVHRLPTGFELALAGEPSFRAQDSHPNDYADWQLIQVWRKATSLENTCWTLPTPKGDFK